jgi:Major intrinsic protein
MGFAFVLIVSSFPRKYAGSKEESKRSASTIAVRLLALYCATGHSAEQVHTIRGGRMMIQRLAAEALGTFFLVFAGCGSALLSAGLPGLGIGVVGIAFAFGVAVVTMVYAFGHISGCHINPAVTIGLLLSKRFPAHEVPGYIAAQVIGGRSPPARWR